MEEILVRRKKTWMKQNIKWLNKWNIKLHECPDTNSEIKIYVKEKFRTAMWSNQIGRKKAYYIKEFNPAKEHGEKPYLGATIKGKARLLIAQLRTGSHHLRCETGRWKTPKETWEERTCLFCNKGVVETEWHFVMECTAYENIRNQYSSISDVGNMQQLFEEDKINQTASLLVKINSRRSDLEKSLETN